MHIGKAKVVFTSLAKPEIDNRLRHFETCYNVHWASQSDKKAPLLDCFGTASKMEMNNIGDGDDVPIKVIMHGK